MIIDTQARQQIRQAIAESSHSDVYSLIDLADGDQLLLLCRAGEVAICLIDREGDLFDPHLMQDVGALVLADLESDCDPAQGVLVQ